VVGKLVYPTFDSRPTIQLSICEIGRRRPALIHINISVVLPTSIFPSSVLYHPVGEPYEHTRIHSSYEIMGWYVMNIKLYLEMPGIPVLVFKNFLTMSLGFPNASLVCKCVGE